MLPARTSCSVSVELSISLRTLRFCRGPDEGSRHHILHVPSCRMNIACRGRRQSYDHRIRDAIGFTGNPRLYETISIPMSTRRTWASGQFRASREHIMQYSGRAFDGVVIPPYLGPLRVDNAHTTSPGSGLLCLAAPLGAKLTVVREGRSPVQNRLRPLRTGRGTTELCSDT